ncbi:hypothetical protein K435DRAFT_675917, partial [Dendrothele bispora CBS 962.96]
MPDDELKLEAAAYSTPAAHIMFSTEFFRGLKFSQVTDVDMPPIARPGVIDSYFFVPTVPISAMATVLRSQDIVFHIDDIQPILSKLEDEYICGNRAVRVRLCGEVSFETFHFSKIRLFALINNFQLAVQAAQRLVHVAPNLSLPQEFLSGFLNLRISDTIAGLIGSSFPLWQLSNFLDETWTVDDSLNALSELLYLR